MAAGSYRISTALRVITGLALGCCLGWGTPAAAEPSKAELQVARSLFTEAMADEAREDWSAALAKLERVQTIVASASARFHIGLCTEKLGRLADALSDYEAAKLIAEREQKTDVLAALEEPLTRLRREVPTLTLTASASLPGARILIDQQDLTAIGFETPFRLDVGKHHVRVEAARHQAFERTLDLPKGARETLAVSLAPIVAVTAPPAEDSHRMSFARKMAIATTAGTVVLAGVGVGAYFVADGFDITATCAAAIDCSGTRNKVRAWDAVALGSFVGAGALAITSVVLWTRPGHQSTQTALVAGPGSLTLRGSF